MRRCTLLAKYGHSTIAFPAWHSSLSCGFGCELRARSSSRIGLPSFAHAKPRNSAMPSVTASFPAAETEPTACFSVHAAANPGIMPRVLELFAKRGLVPTSWTSRVGHEQDLTIDIQMRGMDGSLTDYITACMRQIVGVEVVLISEKRQGRAIP